MNEIARKTPPSVDVKFTHRCPRSKRSDDDYNRDVNAAVEDVSPKAAVAASVQSSTDLSAGTGTSREDHSIYKTLKRRLPEADKTKDQLADCSFKKKLKGSSDQSEDGKLEKREIKSEMIQKLFAPGTLSKCRVLKAENLHCDYFTGFYSRREAGDLLRACEGSLEYFTGKLATVRMYGKNIPIPRKQTAHGDEGLTYKYSGVIVPAKPWLPILESIRKRIEDQTSFRFNFVLVNRYKDGCDSMGEHRDDEKDLDPKHPIASLSLGQERDFVFRHKDTRGKKKTREIEPFKIELGHGSLLMINYPTNQYWYHSLPRRPAQPGVRINMTFRKILRQGVEL